MAILSWGNTLRRSIVLGSLFAAMAHGQNADEYQVKAAFLYNFAKFVEWPSETFKRISDPITICILGQNPFGHALEEAVAGKSVAGRGIVVREVPDVKEGGTCQIVFVSSSERKRWKAILDKVKSDGVLTVGESAEFAACGGIISLKLEDGKVRFLINVDAAEQKKLRISSKLLGLAEVVRK